MRTDDVALVRMWQMAPHVEDWWDDEGIMPPDGSASAPDQYTVAVDVTRGTAARRS